ncbi:hypothetical protein BDB01DRAFT_847739 [Pilobolus umbonatus]|nr:hypothetical protein BDB01DRAFT_847739 [Pilobolus umbonatus]
MSRTSSHAEITVPPTPITHSPRSIEDHHSHDNMLLIEALSNFKLQPNSTGCRFYEEFINVARDVPRKRSEKLLPIKINPAHAK